MARPTTKPWKKVRAGWYRLEVDGVWFHIVQTHRGWGWDVFTSDDQHTYRRERLLCAGRADLGWALIDAEDKITRLTGRRVRESW